MSAVTDGKYLQTPMHKVVSPPSNQQQRQTVYTTSTPHPSYSSFKNTRTVNAPHTPNFSIPEMTPRLRKKNYTEQDLNTTSTQLYSAESNSYQFNSNPGKQNVLEKEDYRSTLTASSQHPRANTFDSRLRSNIDNTLPVPVKSNTQESTEETPARVVEKSKNYFKFDQDSQSTTSEVCEIDIQHLESQDIESVPNTPLLKKAKRKSKKSTETPDEKLVLLNLIQKRKSKSSGSIKKRDQLPGSVRKSEVSVKSKRALFEKAARNSAEVKEKKFNDDEFAKPFKKDVPLENIENKKRKFEVTEEDLPREYFNWIGSDDPLGKRVKYSQGTIVQKRQAYFEVIYN
jgi:hypothetical protein